jgi:hypothetical protein
LFFSWLLSSSQFKIRMPSAVNRDGIFIEINYSPDNYRVQEEAS